MKLLSYRDNSEIPLDTQSDVEYLAEQLFLAGYVASHIDIYRAWNDYSDSCCAGWIMVDVYPDDNVANLMRYLK